MAPPDNNGVDTLPPKQSGNCQGVQQWEDHFVQWSLRSENTSGKQSGTCLPMVSNFQGWQNKLNNVFFFFAKSEMIHEASFQADSIVHGGQEPRVSDDELRPSTKGTDA